MHGFMDRLARLFALAGGAVLSILVIQTCLSILGRSLNSILHSDAIQSSIPTLAAMLLSTGVGPINGDYELVEAGMAFTIFTFIPLCQLNGAHASVDIMTAKLPRGIRQVLSAAIEAIFAGVLIVIAWQMNLGMFSKLNSGQTTFLLQFPLWWAYAFALTGAIASAVVAIYVAGARMVEIATGNQMLPVDSGAGQ